MFSKEVSFAHQGCICLNKNTTTKYYEILLHFKMLNVTTSM